MTVIYLVDLTDWCINVSVQTGCLTARSEVKSSSRSRAVEWSTESEWSTWWS